MTPNHGLRHRNDQTEVGHEAISTFLYLGERVRAHAAHAAHSHGAQRNGGASQGHGAAKNVTLDEEGSEALLRVIEGDIIPRLLLAHQQPPGSDRPESDRGTAITLEDRSRFLELIVGDSASAARTLVDGLLERGVSREALFLDLLSHTARRLGELWDADLCDFADVTIGLCRLHQVLREQSLSRDWDDPRLAAGAPRILLSTACGDQHVFGTVMVGEFFRRDGWRVWSEPGAACERLADIVRSEHFDMLGISAATSHSPEVVKSEIETLRKSSCNHPLKVLVGGRLFADSPELVKTVGADAMATDARTAPEVGRGLLARRRIPC